MGDTSKKLLQRRMTLNELRHKAREYPSETDDENKNLSTTTATESRATAFHELSQKGSSMTKVSINALCEGTDFASVDTNTE
ncbi:hypothetical protein GN244_ATG00048 [Phytophthora infestans]|uniref:Uncharacterized protein n=1 Tax=Phytophthora infestans TaxID=4787 RepID=A0A833W958_PHYIN|nr:hypothetical protein GN244_ATG00048 [Phytophthora infestans]KAF4129140.1 hypothetical protein GN958_ATG21695 [Phytophthora infestans]